MRKYVTAEVTTKDELAALSDAFRRKQYVRLGRSYPVPFAEEAEEQVAIPPFVIGLTARGEYVTLPPDSRTTSTHIIAAPGVGKTNLLETLAMADVTHGLGVIFIDPHGDVIRNLLWRIVEEAPERINDVVLLDPTNLNFPFGLPLYRHHSPLDGHAFQRAVDQSVHVYEALWGGDGSKGTSWGPQLALVARAVGHTLVETGGSLLDVPRLLTNATFRHELELSNPAVAWFWDDLAPKRGADQLEFFGSFANKVLPFAFNQTIAGIVGQRSSKVNVRELMDAGRIVLLPLSIGVIGPDAASLLGSILIGELLTAARSRAELPERERKQVMLYLDEYQLFQSPDLMELEAEARKYHVGLHRAHQRLGQLGEAAREGALMADNLILGRVPGETAAQAAGEFDNTPASGPPEFKPLMMRSRIGEFEQLKQWYGFGRDAESYVQYEQVPGPELSTDEMKNRRKTALVKLPSYEFMAKLLQGKSPQEYAFRAIASPCFGRVPSEQVQERIEEIRQRSQTEFCTERESIGLHKRGQERLPASTSSTLRRSGTL